MQDWILDIWEQFKRTVLFVTHSIDEAIYLSDRVYVITERPGRVAAEFDINLTRPRSKSIITSEEFSLYKEKMLASLGQIS
jgi:ABC-type nitrate/sulfonate/bicarbonate transport system ATPase subunit